VSHSETNKQTNKQTNLRAILVALLSTDTTYLPVRLLCVCVCVCFYRIRNDDSAHSSHDRVSARHAATNHVYHLHTHSRVQHGDAHQARTTTLSSQSPHGRGNTQLRACKRLLRFPLPPRKSIIGCSSSPGELGESIGKERERKKKRKQQPADSRISAILWGIGEEKGVKGLKGGASASASDTPIRAN
jgi:hypothetical protein